VYSLRYNALQTLCFWGVGPSVVVAVIKTGRDTHNHMIAFV